ncbi:cutinase family protein [Nocardia paucivorans]|uniref:cutinase family protein n=1 Tax=Nocardia paucivorans TaxID=114259 RepID=UPI0002F0D160|nr:cutinase family protein [Nocardia paucivorans]
MALREFIARYRITPAVAAPAVLGLAAVIATSVAVTAPQRSEDTRLRASVTECHDMVTISVAGRNDTPREGTTKMLVGANGELLPAALSGDHNSEWVDPVVNAPADDVEPGSYAAVYIAYPANMATYEDAVTAGVANTQQVMREIAQACPDTRFSIVGYSEGADVVRRVAMNVGNQQPGADGYGIVDPDDVLGVVILADPGRSVGDGPFPGAQNPYGNPDGFDRQYQNGISPISGRGALPGTSGGFGALDGKVASFCSEGDLTCAAPENISLLHLAVNVGRQLNVDALEREGLTPATGHDVAVVLGRIALAAFADIQSQPNWMSSDETFLEVLLRVSDPAYRPGQPPVESEPAQSIATEELSPLAYLPQKVFNEIVGLIVTNQNTIPVIMSDPYKLTLGPNHTGHHFDYWRDADPDNGKPLTSAEYAAAWLTHLAKQAQAGKPIDPSSEPEPEDFTDAYRAVAATSTAPTIAPTSTPPSTAPTSIPTTTGPGPTTTDTEGTPVPTSVSPPATPDTSVPALPSTSAVPTEIAETARPSTTVAPTEAPSTTESPTTTSESTTPATDTSTTTPTTAGATTPLATTGTSAAAPN